MTLTNSSRASTSGGVAAPGATCQPGTSKDGFRSDTDEIGSGCHLLPHFNPDTNTNANLIGYEYKTDSSNPDTNPDNFLI